MFEQAARLAAVADLPWHAERDVLSFQHRYMNAAFARPASETASFIAEDEAADRLGYVYAEASTDFVTLEPCAYVTVLAVTEAAEGQGVTARPMQAAEDWARAGLSPDLPRRVCQQPARPRLLYAAGLL